MYCTLLEAGVFIVSGMAIGMGATILASRKQDRTVDSLKAGALAEELEDAYQTSDNLKRSNDDLRRTNSKLKGKLHDIILITKRVN